MTFGKGNAKASKLDAVQVLQIRKLYAAQTRQARVTYEMLARQFEVTPGTIRNVILGLTWQGVTEVPTDQTVLRRLAAQSSVVLPTQDEQRAAADRIQALIAQRTKAIPVAEKEPDGLTGMQRLMREVEARRIANAEPSLDDLMDDKQQETKDDTTERT